MLYFTGKTICTTVSHFPLVSGVLATNCFLVSAMACQPLNTQILQSPP